MDDLFLESPDETLGHSVGLRLLDEGEAGRDAPEAQLAEEVVREELRPVVHAQLEATAHTPRLPVDVRRRRHGAGGCSSALVFTQESKTRTVFQLAFIFSMNSRCRGFFWYASCAPSRKYT